MSPKIKNQKSKIKNVLMLTHRVPFPLDRGDRIRAYHLLEYLSRRFDVSIACTSDEPVDPESEQVLRDLAKQVAIARIGRSYGKIRGLTGMLMGGAVTPGYFYRGSLAKTIQQWHAREPFDTVLTYCTGMIHYARQLTAKNRTRKTTLAASELARPALRHVIDLVDVDSVKWTDYADETCSPILRWIYRTESKRLRHIEAGRDDYFNAITLVGDAEARTYCEHVGEHPGLTVVRHGVDVDYFQPVPDAVGRSILFVGVLNYPPNATGITWFVEQVLPRLRDKLSDLQLVILGRHATPAIRALGNRPGVTFVGSVPDVRPYLRDTAAVVAPLRIARGVQSKILEAMASRRAVVCSPAAAKGIDAIDGEHLLVADQPDQWVAQLRRVLTDTSLRSNLATAARQRVEECYSWEQCLRPLDALMTGEPVDGARDSRRQDHLRQAA